MQRTLLICVIVFSYVFWACQDTKEENSNELTGYYNSKAHHDQWDNQIHPLLLQYYASLSSFREQDSTLLNAAAHSIMESMDTLSKQWEVDTVGKKYLLEALYSLRDEYSALPMEKDWNNIQIQMNMIAREWIYLLGVMGYQKTPVYILEQDGSFWLSSEKSAFNPFKKTNTRQTASYLLQELPPNKAN